MPSGNPVSGTLSMDAKVYGTKENATPEAGYHEMQKGRTYLLGTREERASHRSSREQAASGVGAFPPWKAIGAFRRFWVEGYLPLVDLFVE